MTHTERAQYLDDLEAEVFSIISASEQPTAQADLVEATGAKSEDVDVVIQSLAASRKIGWLPVPAKG